MNYLFKVFKGFNFFSVGTIIFDFSIPLFKHSMKSSMIKTSQTVMIIIMCDITPASATGQIMAFEKQL
ncbi:hypothetical protein EL17_13880 [Anditalea andensis]|uniref:Uncharacterized protein n=1 Tax=Anditalea andensis TaxID=1048983 RepID=A0A074KWT6_9BACT|nr:hypothetical protein EL17_13880 [Anditalea andensis]